MNPVVSVIIPTYKHAGYVLETLESVFAQTFTSYEVIVVNDGSPDDTAGVLRPLVEAGRILYIEQANAGQASARNRGLAEARGELIAFLDDDDLWPPDKLAWQVEALRAHPDVGAVAGEITSELPLPAQTVGAAEERVTYQDLFNGNKFHSPGQVLIRAEDLRAVGGLNPRIWGVDDLDLFLRLAMRRPISVARRTALYYRVHAGNASHQKDRMLGNAALCLRLRLRDVPWRLRWSMTRRAYRWLYAYLGRDLLRGNAPSTGGGLRARGVRAARFARYFWLACLADPRLCQHVWRDLRHPR